ncbi:hypothetical protein KSB_63260 [Ktedonobacter robiniae]|uniref:Integrase SAM-like N-terminal domain-containing protein n=1 Tax=Ktedonobacter robiniae TaxID=2778365 RepID=A0ABQ3UYB7_9CHLR|nr:hypothetical protein KSB_63260 [Ktedonobacter robiniae]
MSLRLACILPSKKGNISLLTIKYAIIAYLTSWVREVKTRRYVTPIHGQEVAQALHILMRVPDRIAQSAVRGQAPQAGKGSPGPCLKVASLEQPLPVTDTKEDDSKIT